MTCASAGGAPSYLLLAAIDGGPTSAGGQLRQRTGADFRRGGGAARVVAVATVQSGIIAALVARLRGRALVQLCPRRNQRCQRGGGVAVASAERRIQNAAIRRACAEEAALAAASFVGGVGGHGGLAAGRGIRCPGLARGARATGRQRRTGDLARASAAAACGRAATGSACGRRCRPASPNVSARARAATGST